MSSVEGVDSKGALDMPDIILAFGEPDDQDIEPWGQIGRGVLQEVCAAQL